jgi:uncharacterized protein (TIGR02231 family)
MRPIALAAFAGLAIAGAPALADDIVVEAPIRSVIVYPQGAAITREAPFLLPAGNSVVIIDNIPNGIDTGSVRVEGVGGTTATIQSVVIRRGETDDSDNPERVRLVEAIEDLREQLALLGDQRIALEAQRQFIGNLVEAGPAGFAELLGGEGAGIDQWQTAWRAIGEGMTEIIGELRRLALEERDIQDEIQELTEELANLPTKPAHYEILVDIAATAETDLELAVTYQLANAYWQPTYDAMLSTDAGGAEPMVELIRRADIVQNTGEDWTDVQLTLSTSRPSGGTDAPTVGAAQVGVFNHNARFDMTPAAEAADAVGIAGALAPQPPPIANVQAIADFGDFKADYIIPIPVSVESGGGSRSVQIATETADARLFVEAAPRFSEQAYLTAAFSIDSSAPILAGRVTLFRDDAYVGTGSLAFANPGEEIELGFGPDDLVWVTWRLVDRSGGQRGLLTRIDFEEIEYLATIENNHTRAIEITIVDRVPFSEDERIVVDVLPQSTEPTEEDIDGRRGVVSWTYEYEAGEIREITNAYVISWPADLNVFGVD